MDKMSVHFILQGIAFSDKHLVVGRLHIPVMFYFLAKECLIFSTYLIQLT